VNIEDIGTGGRFGHNGTKCGDDGMKLGDMGLVATAEAKFGDVATGGKFGDIDVDGGRLGDVQGTTVA
jgi:hypothetical protein